MSSKTQTYIREHASDQLTAGDGQGKVDDHSPPSAVGEGEDVSYVRQPTTRDVPFRRLAHATDDAVQGLLATFLERLGDRLGALLVGGVFKKAGDQMIERHLPVLVGAVLED